MFSNRKARLLLACAIMFVAVSAQAQMQTEKGSVVLARGTSLIGHDVLDNQGNKVGTIKDIVLTKRGDKVTYAAVSRGIAGIGNTFLPIPWSAFKVTPVMEEKPSLLGEKDREFKLALNVSKDTIEKARTVREDAEWPTRINPDWSAPEAAAALKEERAAAIAAGRTPEFGRLSKLIGQNVFSTKPLESLKSTDKPMIGELKDVALNVHTGTPVYGEIKVTNIKDRENFRSIVPFSALELRMEGTTPQVALDVPNTETLLAYGYQADQTMPALGEKVYAERIYTAYNQQPDWEMLGFVSPEVPRTEEPMRIDEQRKDEMRGEPGK